jgi:pectin methylesterase-like acyl-CoA thioesterase
MNIQKIRKPVLLGLVCNLVCLLAARAQNGNTNIWFGPGAGLNNWSTALNWTNATTGTQSGLIGGDDVEMFSTGGTTVSNVNSVVDVNTTVGSLVYGSTNNATLHTTLINDGVTLSVTNTGGLWVGMVTDPNAPLSLTNTVTGPNGALIISNASANVGINQCNGLKNGPSRATFDLSGLGTFIVNGNRLGIGDGQFPGVVINQSTGGNLILARTNVISLAYSDTLANYRTAGKNYAITMSRNSGNNPGIISVIQLGITNAFFVDSMDIGMDKSGNNSTSAHGVIMFNPAFGANAPSAYFRGINGATDPTSRVTWWGVGDGNTSASSSNGGGGTNDFSLGTIDAMIDTLSLARDAASSSDAWGGPHKGVFTFAAGTVDANNVIVGNQSLETGTSTTASWGQMNVKGATAVLKVNSTLTLGSTTLTNAAGLNTRGQLYISGGSVYASNVVVGAASVSNLVAVSSGTLVISNTLATNASGLFVFSLTNSTLGLTVTADGGQKVLTKTLNTFGATNYIRLDPATVIFPTYPQQFALIKYTTWAGTNNFGLASVPAWAPGATIVSNGVNASLDLVVPFDPRPVFTAQPSPYSGSPGDNVTSSLAVTIDPNSVQPLGYQWYYVTSGNVTNLLADGAGPSGTSALTGSTTANLQINSAQIGDSGNYFVVVTNAFGTNASSAALLTISAGAIAPNVTGPAALTMTNGITAAIGGTVSGSPVPTVHWQFNGVDLADGPGPSGSSTITGATTAMLTIANPQYPGDQGTYSLIAVNSAGKATNDTVVTVIVPPSIGTQPANAVVTNTQLASFTIGASGVPSPTYQWYKNSLANPISGAVNGTATNATFIITNAAPSDIATYFAVVQNAAGSVTSSNATLTVNSTMSATTLKPANGATGISYDTPLYVTFSVPPSVRAAGKIKIFNVTNGAAPVDTLDLNQGLLQPRTIATETFSTYPVIITGNTAAIYPHLGVLTSNQTYYVTIDDGVFADTNGAYFAGIADTNAWQFTTKASGPANSTNMVVAQDYSGDFATVQGALDSLPANNVNQALVNVRDGIYTEVVEFKKSNIVVRGQSRNGTIIGYANNSNLNGSTHSRMAMKINANDIALDNLTVSNSTPQDLSQAEALMIETSAARIIVNNCKVASYQDTILANTATSKAYFNRSLIQGDVDFIWGGGNLFFTNCEVRWLIRAGNSAALGPNPSPGASEVTSNGFSFVNCALTTLPGANPADTVGRTRGIAGGNTALINCFVSTNIGGWSSDALPTSNFRNWYYGCTNDLGAAAGLSNGIPLAVSDPNLANASNATVWLYGWQPQLSPNILTNPASQTVDSGSPVTFTVVATGIPDPTYQWQLEGTNLDGATGASLTIPSATSANVGTYSVIVTTSAGSVTSAPATLAVTPNAAPVFTAPADGANFAFNVGANIAISCTATDAPNQTLTYSLLFGPTNAAVNATSGNFTWRPVVAQADTTNIIMVVATDNGVPVLSATNSFTITVNPLTSPGVSSPAIIDGQFTMSVSGQLGPDYTLQVSTNLLGGWTSLYTTNPTTMPFTFTDTNSVLPEQYYRVLVGP